MGWLSRFGATLAAATFGAAIHTTPVMAQAGLFAPEAESGWSPKPPASASRYMVAAANPLAAKAGLDILRAGGSAVDAVITIQLVLGLVEPQSSGLGGGAFLLHWDAASRKLDTYDGREVAPVAATPSRFLANGQPIAFRKAVKSALSIGVPGTLRLLEAAHRKSGRLPWKRLFQPAIRMAEAGFNVSPRLHRLLAASDPATFDTAARTYFFAPSGAPWPVGHLLRNPAYAETLQQIAGSGADILYTGPLAQQIVAAAQTHDPAKGSMTLDDLARYRVIMREPVCQRYRGHNVCIMGPPSSGGLTIAQVLGMLGGDNLGRSPKAAMAPATLHLVEEALKLAFADRNRYLADPDFITPPHGLLAPSYLQARRALIPPWQPVPRIAPGQPPGAERQSLGRDATREVPGTSHIAIIDATGDVVSMTTTIESAFGSGRSAGGFLLNNELTDFSFRPADINGHLIANRVEGGKRPRSSMSPTIVLGPSGSPVIVTGSAGGSRIIPYVLKTLIAILDWKLDPTAALALPNFGSIRPGPFTLEPPHGGAFTAPWNRSGALSIIGTALRLKSYGYDTTLAEQTSGTQVIVRHADGRLEGAADPRREGVALGD
ncbi:MAG: gamma-glutamyltransferase family protein [Hyphomicrobiaceae bacterium]